VAGRIAHRELEHARKLGKTAQGASFLNPTERLGAWELEKQSRPGKVSRTGKRKQKTEDKGA
jgi:hypothetical protein